MVNDKCSMINVYDELFAYCETENFAGYDPFDGLNSRIFQASPLKYFSLMRLAWLQMVKRSAKDLRPALKVEKGVNAKGIAHGHLDVVGAFFIVDMCRVGVRRLG